jgi:DNA-binding phage protein
MDGGDIRTVARKSLLQLLEPLLGFVLDSGLSTHELHSILRQAAVQTVAARQMELARRVNISGIAASTGIPRAEISKILKSKADSRRQPIDRHQQTTNRILAVWHQDPRFITPGGKPADLQIYGRGATFESLVRNYGRGIPTRAMLDELTRAGAAELLSPRLVRAKNSVAVERGMTLRGIRAFGDRATELLSTMLENIRNPKNPQFVASISGSNVSPEILPLFRRELSYKGADFLASMHDSLIRDTKSGLARTRPTGTSRVSVTIFYNESARKAKPRTGALKKRRNFRRDD